MSTFFILNHLQILRRLKLVLVILCIGSTVAKSQIQFGRYPFNSSMACAVSDSIQAWNSISTLGVFTNFGRSSGISCVSSTNTFESKNWATAGTRDTTDYVGFVLQLNSPQTLRNDTLSFDCWYNRNSDGPKTAAVFYRYGNNIFVQVGGYLSVSTAGTNVRSTIPAPGNITSTILEIRIFAWRASKGGGRFAVDNARLSGADYPLPVELTTFSASYSDRRVTLKWTTATEINNYGFDVERSVTSLNDAWEKVGFVDGHGTVNTAQSYFYIDDLRSIGSLPNTFSYRLNQIDRDGKTSYSPIVSVQLITRLSSVYLAQNYPNPFNPTTKISFTLPTAQHVDLIVHNILGQEITKLVSNELLERGSYTYTFSADQISSGVYLYTLKTELGNFTRRMIVMK